MGVHPKLLHNGHLRDAQDLVLSPGQVGFLNGWGVFSTLRVSEGVLFAYERHFARLRRDAERLKVPFAISQEHLYETLLSLIEANEATEAVLRVAIVRNRGGLFEAPGLERDYDLIAFTAELRQWGSAAHLSYFPNGRFGASPFAGIKSLSWAQNLTLYERAHEMGFDEFILLNEHGEVSECTSANVFAIQGDHVFTPPLRTSGCLPGVTRAILLEEIRLEGIEIGERELTPSSLEESDMVFITSTTRDLLPVATLDGFALRTTNDVFEQLRSAYLENRSAYLASALSRRCLVTS